MQYTFLGTGAADFSPLLERELADQLDKNARRSSSLLINGELLIDCGPHTVRSAELLGVNQSEIRNLLITHLHADHFAPDVIQTLAQGKKTLHVWHCEGAPVPEIEGVTYHPLRPFETYTVERYHITALPANHTGFPVHYSVTESAAGKEREKKLFYGCDGAWFLNETFYWLWNQLYDIFILDGTVGDTLGDFRMAEHNSIPMIRLMLPSLQKQGVIGPHTRVYLSHIARTLHTGHEELTALLSKDGLLAAYDGLEEKI